MNLHLSYIPIFDTIRIIETGVSIFLYEIFTGCVTFYALCRDREKFWKLWFIAKISQLIIQKNLWSRFAAPELGANTKFWKNLSVKAFYDTLSVVVSTQRLTTFSWPVQRIMNNWRLRSELTVTVNCTCPMFTVLHANPSVELIDGLCDNRDQIILTRDFNSKHPELGNDQTKPSGTRLVTATQNNNLTLINDGTPAFLTRFLPDLAINHP